MFRCFDMTGFKMIRAFQSREEKVYSCIVMYTV